MGQEGATTIAVPVPRGDDAAEEALFRVVDQIICGYIRHEGDDLSVRQLAVLVQLTQSPRMVTPLANELGLSLSTVSRSLDTLEKLRLAKRTRSGRQVTAAATPLGHAKIGRLMLWAAHLGD